MVSYDSTGRRIPDGFIEWIQAPAAPVIPETKRCRGECKAVKPLSEFGKHAGGKHGLRAQCRDCYNAYMRKLMLKRGASK